MAVDPICGMEVDPARAAVRVEYQGKVYHFCSTTCHKIFSGDPSRFAPQVASTEARPRRAPDRRS